MSNTCNHLIKQMPCREQPVVSYAPLVNFAFARVQNNSKFVIVKISIQQSEDIISPRLRAYMLKN